MSDLENRDELEAGLAKDLAKKQIQQLKKLMELIGDAGVIANIPEAFWDGVSDDLRGVFTTSLQETYLQSAENLLSQSTVGVDWALVNQAAIKWVKEYSFALIRGINETSRQAVADALESYYQGGLTIGELEKMLAPTFGPVRAAMIASTEITRAAVEGELGLVAQIEKDNPGIRMVAEWSTNADDIVCKICGPLNGRRESGRDGDRPYWDHPSSGKKYGPPPGHVNCRCWVNHEMTVV